MVQLLESTKSYLKNSTKLGRRMSQYKNEMSSSEASLPSVENTAADAKQPRSSTEKSPTRASQQYLQRPPSSQNRLSGLFNLARSNSSIGTKHSASSPTEETRSSSGLFPRKIGPDTTETGDDKRRNSKSSDRTHATNSDKSHHSSSNGSNHDNGRRRSSYRVSSTGATSLGSDDSSPANLHLLQEQHHRDSQILDRDRRRASRAQSQYDEVPRGRSPTWSMSNTISTATSSYHTQPSDYPSMKHYQAHVWRRQLLEDSIMQSLKLGYADRQRSASRQRSRSLKRNSRARKAKEQAMLAAALGKDLPSSPLAPGSQDQQQQQQHLEDGQVIIEEVKPRSLDVLKPLPHIKNNSPYMAQTNASMLNITQSFASFTLELDEHDVHRVMSSSAVPNLFRIKSKLDHGHAPRPRRNSKSSRIISTNLPAISPRGGTVPNVGKHRGGGEVDESLASPTADWASSVLVSLEKHQEGSITLAHNGTTASLPAATEDDPRATKDTPSVIHLAAATAV